LPLLEGADLTVRPDVFDRVIQLYRSPLFELRVVWRRDINVDEQDS
jgi:hypothetical protein